jgi:HEAT repeat protein
MQTKQQRARNAVRFLSDPRKDRGGRLERRIALIGKEAVEPLLEAIDSPSKEMRMRCAYALGMIGDHRAFEAILYQLLSDPDNFVRYEAAISLGNLGDERAIPYLVDILQEPDIEDAVPSAAASALVDVGKKAVPFLLPLLESADSETQGSAVCVLGCIAEPATFDSIAALSASEDENVRLAAVEAIGRFGQKRHDSVGPRCLGLLHKHLSDPSGQVREESESGIEDIQSVALGYVRREESMASWRVRLIRPIASFDARTKRFAAYRRKRRRMGINR